MSRLSARPDLSHVEAWVFDLDDTLYPREQGVMNLVQGRINAFMVDAVGLPADEARVLQKQFLTEHGTTLAGLMANYAIDPERFLREVHDVPLDTLEPNPRLDAVLDGLPGRKYVLTNGARCHAARVLDRIGITDRFDGVFAIEDMDLTPKPAPATYRRFLERFGVDPHRAVFFEDTPRNLAPAKALGMATVLIGDGHGHDLGDWIDAQSPDLLDFLVPLSLKDAA
ncbi:pyrimidine 5'-nucleotidase [Brevundimonas sp. LM2]|uniref:pyrimidine 5'-nucleotidase n=1 Tax=Brevundimonas sp. LM2 TaxID=1938605 RepID=UPI0009840246|nr:pyrimidine 5'-nucleotidase [Brevundimonas sp. LM2]AQR60872.1 pyrimidine 5'-nucleotidase [Brevundimonas sp. LM2]